MGVIQAGRSCAGTFGVPGTVGRSRAGGCRVVRGGESMHGCRTEGPEARLHMLEPPR